MPYSNSNAAPFDYSTLDSAKPATYNQLKFRVGNVATIELFSRIGLDRDNFKSANRKIFTQMASALQTATIEKPLTNADIQAMDTGKTSLQHLSSKRMIDNYSPIFERAFAELYCTGDELYKLLIKDGLSARKADAAANKYSALHGDLPPVEAPKAKAPKAKAPKAKAPKAPTVTTRVKAKTPKAKTVEVKTVEVKARAALTDDQKADAIATLQQRLDELLAM